MRCVAENAELQKKISLLETQNRTLVRQLLDNLQAKLR